MSILNCSTRLCIINHTGLPATFKFVPKNPMRIQPLVPETGIQEQIAGKMITGALLKELRKNFNISIDELHERTKITRHTIQNIEMENYECLPALVYLRGFLKEIAKALSLPIDRCVDEYCQGYHTWSKQSST